MIGAVRRPAPGTAMPSAIVVPPTGSFSGGPSSIIEGYRSLCTPITSMSGRTSRGRHGHAGEEATAADGHDDHVEVGRVLQHLEGHGPLPGDDVRVVEGRHEHQALGLLELVGEELGLGDVVAVQHDPGAEGLGAVAP